MANRVYLTNKELWAIINTCEEWSDMMSCGDNGIELVEERMQEGLGSALKKLSAGTGTRLEKIYKNY